MKNNEIIKLDVDMLEPFDKDQMLVVKGGFCWPCVTIVVEIVIAILTDDEETDNCDCTNNCDC